MNILAFLYAGLLDGVNPCSFATGVFFISWLSLFNFEKNKVAVAGGFFVATAFVSYFLLNVGIFEPLRALVAFSVISSTFYLFIAVLAIVFGGLHLRDWFDYRKNADVERFFLKFPAALTGKDSAAKKLLSFFGLAALGILAGFFVPII